MSIRVFVGCAASGEDAESLAVLEWSIRKHTRDEVDITWMKQTHDADSFWHGWNTDRWATPFSGFRWGIPAACDFKGKAIYTDSDVIFLAPLDELWRQRVPKGAVALAKPGSWRMCVSMWDCKAAKAVLPSLEVLRGEPRSHADCSSIMRQPGLMAPFAGNWNCLDGEDYESLQDPDIKALHYTDMSTQPHLRHALPRLEAAGQRHWFDGTVREHRRPDVVALFDQMLEEAKANGFHPENYVPTEPFGPYRKASLVNYKGRPAA